MSLHDVPLADVFEWAKSVDTLDGALLQELLDAPYTTAEPERAEAAMHAVTFASLPPAMVIDVANRLLDIADDEAIDAPIRGHALEAVGNHLSHTAPGALRTRAVTRVMARLGDSAPEVRFWCAFALGSIGDPAAIGPLSKLTSDPALVPGWWTVGEEAQDAVVVIEGGVWPERIGRQAPPN